MYSLTEVPLNDPALLALFKALSDALGHTAQEDPQQLAMNGADVLVAVLAWHDGKAVGCGLLLRLNDSTAEIKRMYSRQPGVGTAVLTYLEHYAVSHGFQKLVGAARIINSKAVNFYLHKGFKKCASYGKYKYSSQSICMEKQLGS